MREMISAASLPKPFRITRSGLFTHFVGHFGDLDRAFGGGERFVPGQECEALGLFAQQAGGQVAVSDAHFAIVGYRSP